MRAGAAPPAVIVQEDRQANTLGLDDDLDPVELRAALEHAFGVRFGYEEAAACRTVADLFRMVCNRLPQSAERTERCITAMAFHRLRRAMPASDGVRLRPSSMLTSEPRVTAWRLLTMLGRRSGLRLPHRRTSLMGQAGGWMIAAGLVWLFATAIVAPGYWYTGVLGCIVGVALVRVDPGRLPSDCQTLGGLARKAAALNFGDLVNAGARPRDRDVWNALIVVVADYTDLGKADIHPGTLILHR